MIEIPSTPWRTAAWSFAEAVEAAPAAVVWSPLPGTVRHGFTHFRLELAVVAGIGVADGIWTPIERLADHALPTLMKKVARHAISAPAANPYTGSAASAANSGRSLSTASRTGMKERR